MTQFLSRYLPDGDAVLERLMERDEPALSQAISGRSDLSERLRARLRELRASAPLDEVPPAHAPGRLERVVDHESVGDDGQPPAGTPRPGPCGPSCCRCCPPDPLSGPRWSAAWRS